jgi:hypothetical protein
MTKFGSADPRLEPLRQVFRAVQDVQTALETIRLTDIGRMLRDDPTDPLSSIRSGFTAPIAELKRMLCSIVPTGYCERCEGKGCAMCGHLGFEFRAKT